MADKNVRSARHSGEREDRESSAARKASLIKQQAAKRGQLGLRPDDIGVVRVEFTLPASRLIGPGNLTGGGVSTGPTVDADGDPTDDILIFDGDFGPNSDPVLQVPWPPGTDPD